MNHYEIELECENELFFEDAWHDEELEGLPRRHDEYQDVSVSWLDAWSWPDAP